MLISGQGWTGGGTSGGLSGPGGSAKGMLDMTEDGMGISEHLARKLAAEQAKIPGFDLGPTLAGVGAQKLPVPKKWRTTNHADPGGFEKIDGKKVGDADFIRKQLWPDAGPKRENLTKGPGFKDLKGAPPPLPALQRLHENGGRVETTIDRREMPGDKEKPRAAKSAMKKSDSERPLSPASPLSPGRRSERRATVVVSQMQLRPSPGTLAVSGESMRR